MNQKKIGFVQALLISIGFVIGSGIFFRADNILQVTHGNILVADLAWISLGLTFVFAGISVSVIAGKSTRTGGMAAYVEDLYNQTSGFAVAFFMACIYTPLFTGVLPIVMMTYICQLFGLDLSLPMFYLSALGIMTLVYAWNFISLRFAAAVSSFATMIKLLPLAFIGILGFIYGDPSQITASGLHSALPGESTGFLVLFTAPLLSIAFAFDGWISVGALSTDMENPNRDLPRVFTVSTLIILVFYVVYFTAVSVMMDPQEIIALGDAHVGVISTKLFGETGAKLILLAVIISVLGTLNSAVMAGMRYMQSIALENNFFAREKIAAVNKKSEIPVFAGAVVFVLTCLAIGLYALQAIYGMFEGIAFDDLPIVSLSFFYIAIFYGIIRDARKAETRSVFREYFAPVVATIGQVFIIASFLITNEAGMLYLGIGALAMGIGLLIRKFAK